MAAPIQRADSARRADSAIVRADPASVRGDLYWRSWSTQPSAFDDFVEANDRVHVGDLRDLG